MGRVIVCDCSNCGYIKEYLTGTGFRDYAPDCFADDKPPFDPSGTIKRLRTRIRHGEFGKKACNQLLKYPKAHWDIEVSAHSPYPYYCPKCHKVVPKKYLDQMTRYDPERIEPIIVDLIVKCGQCHSRLLAPRESVWSYEHLTCPFCHQDTFTIGMGALWD